MTWFVYLIWDVVSERRYFGKTNDVAKRWREHNNESIRSSNRLLTRALRKAFNENECRFVYSVLSEHQTEQEALKTEQFWIDMFKSNACRYPNVHGLNMTDGGEGCSGRVVSDATRKKTSNSLKGHAVSEQTRKRLREAQLGNTRHFTASHRASLKKAARRKLDDEALVLMFELKQNGVANSELAVRFNVSERTIRKKLSK